MYGLEYFNNESKIIFEQFETLEQLKKRKNEIFHKGYTLIEV